MKNGKQEFIDNFNQNKVRCAYIWIENGNYETVVTAELKEGFTPEEYENFLNAIDVDYDDGFGVQKLFGTVWLHDNEWATRHEYDGAEWWDLHRYPAIPNCLKIG